MTNRFRVCIMVHRFPPVYSGAGQVAFRLATHLQDRGHQVFVLSRAAPGLPARGRVGDVEVVRVKSTVRSRRLPVEYAVRIGKVLAQRRHDYDAILMFGQGFLPFWTVLMARSLSKPIVYRMTLYSSDDPLAIRTRGRLSWLRFWMFRQIDAYVATSSPLVASYQKCGLPSAKLSCIPNGVDTGWFHPVPAEEKMAVRRRLDLPLDRTLALYVGRLGYLKGVDILLRALASSSTDARCDLVLVIVGDGEERDRLERMISSSQISKSVLMIGTQQDVRDYYWAADIFVLPSRTEGLSNALIEAMACGLPSVVSAVGGSSDLVKEGQNGLLFEAENHEELARQLASMLDTRSRWSELGRQARHMVLATVDLEAVGELVHSTYQQLL